jgi:hypothetical protein
LHGEKWLEDIYNYLGEPDEQDRAGSVIDIVDRQRSTLTVYRWAYAIMNIQILPDIDTKAGKALVRALPSMSIESSTVSMDRADRYTMDTIERTAFNLSKAKGESSKRKRRFNESEAVVGVTAEYNAPASRFDQLEATIISSLGSFLTTTIVDEVKKVGPQVSHGLSGAVDQMGIHGDNAIAQKKYEFPMVTVQQYVPHQHVYTQHTVYAPQSPAAAPRRDISGIQCYNCQ